MLETAGPVWQQARGGRGKCIGRWRPGRTASPSRAHL